MSVNKEFKHDQSPDEKFRQATNFTRIDILTQEDGKWLPYAQSLAYRARQFLKASGQKLFARHYHFGDVKIFIKLSPGAEYIRVRTGEGAFIVVPVVYKISTDAETTGEYTFLNSALSKATLVPADLFDMVSMFPHKVSTSEKITGVVSTTPESVSGYFKGREVVSDGLSALEEYAGVVKHSYIVPPLGSPLAGQPATDHIHMRATDVVDPTPPPEDGIYYNSAIVGSGTALFDDFTLARRPAVHETMLASKDGRKIIAEEWLPFQYSASAPSTAFDAMPFFVMRSIIDIDLGNINTPVMISDYQNLNGYPASDFEATGSGSLDITTVSSGSAGVDHAVSIAAAGSITAPISSALDDSNQIVSTAAVRTYTGQFNSTGSKSGAGPFTYDHALTMSFLENMTITAPGMTPVSIDLLVENLNGAHTFTTGDPFTEYNYTGPWARRFPDFMYSSTSIPALIYRQADYEHTMEMFEQSGDLEARAIDRTERVRVIAVVGTKTIVLSEVVTNPADGDLGIEPSRFGLLHVGIRAEWDGSDEFMAFPSDGTATESPWPDGNSGNLYFRGERRQGPIPEYQGLLLSEYNDMVLDLGADRSIPDAQALFAALSKTKYIGSVYTVHGALAAFPPDTSEYSWVSFSHADDTLKKTIVNFVLAPEEPITGEALADYKIWFTYLRAI